MELLEKLQRWHDEIGPSLTGAGYVVEFTGPIQDRPKPAASILVSSTARITKLTVWSTGEAELDLADAVSGTVIEEHRQITGEVGLSDAVHTLIAWVQGA